MLAVTGVAAQHKTYFVSSSSGDDSASGLSVQEAWKSLDKVNEMTFQPGDRILLKSGDVWYGQLFLKGSGSEGNPISLSSYGGDARPVINIGAAEGAGVRIHNESWWEIDHIEVTSFAAPEIGIGRQGIVVTASESGKEFNHFVIRNCYVHDIWGQMGGNTEYTGYYSCAILVRVMVPHDMRRNPDFVPASMNDVLIEGNRIERFDKCGIISWGPRNNVVVRGNYMDNLGGDGIFVNGPYRGLIEYNEIHRSCMRSGYLDLPGGDDWWPHTAACWIQDTEETVMQFNQVYDTGREPKNGDGFAYDFDFGCVRCVAQYNYSKNNHGFMLLMYNITENVARYNISENDRTHLVQMQGSLTKDRNVFHNNVFYVDYGTSDLDFFIADGVDGIDDIGAMFYNNIFYATGQGRFRTVYTQGDPMVRTFDEVSRPNLPSGAIFKNNCYYGLWKNGLPDDPQALLADPEFVFPGTGGRGLHTLGGYALKPGSPCIDAGMQLPETGGRDFFGNLLRDGKLDIGAFEYSETALAPMLSGDIVAANLPETVRTAPAAESTVLRFDKTRTMPGHKLSLKDFDENFPRDWSGYNYLVLEMSCSSGQRVYVGLDTESGYNELRFIFYAPGGKIRTAIPLDYFRELPAGAHDLAATYNHRRPLSYINIEHGTRCPLTGVDSIGFRMHCPVRDEEIVIDRIYLTVDDPGDKYLDIRPAVDEFGQWNLGEFEGKVHSRAELLRQWSDEEKLLSESKTEGRSAYGGDISRRAEATGFFRIGKIDGKWWFIDPDGYCFLSISSNGIHPTSRDPERSGRGRELVLARMDGWGMNTIGNWSDRGLIAMGKKPFMVSLEGLGIGSGILGMPDVYAKGFDETIDEAVSRSVGPYVNDKMLIGYFVGNEPAWSNNELRLCELILEADSKMPLRRAFEKYLKKHGDTPESRKAFVYETYGLFLDAVDRALDKHDPNHLNLGIRYGSGVPSPEVLELSKRYFDVYSFNSYGILPSLADMDTIYEATGLPMIIGEFHFGTTDRGLGESLVRVCSQEDRGRAYKNYCEAAFSHEALIGTSWFTWQDQPFFGRMDGENYNIGLIDVTDRPYGWMVRAIQDVSRDCYDVHSGVKAPYFYPLERVGGVFPDFWE